MRKIWGGVFHGSSDTLVNRFGQSISSDLNFWQEDVIGSVAHVRMLGATGIILPAEALELERGLEIIHEQGPDCLPRDVEDIHTAVETRLEEIVGEVARKMHTARSRNDQVATDTRLYLHNAIIELCDSIKRLQRTIHSEAIKYKDAIMPGYTHGQRAQPIALGFYLMAHFWALQRQGYRAEKISETANYCPLGSAALAGTGFPIDRFATSSELGFIAPIPNALDATSDRSYILEALNLVAMLMIDLSRISQDLILFSSKEFGFLNLGDAVTTGSSIMPQKRNPDMAELIRGRTGRAIGNWVSLATAMKGLSLGYNRDTQDDKPPLFDSLNLASDSLELVELMLKHATWNLDQMKNSVRGDFSTATDLADFLARNGMPFRQAHEVVGRVVQACIKDGITLEDLTPENLKAIAPDIPVSALECLSPEKSVKSRDSFGGPGPNAFKVQLDSGLQLLEKLGFPLPV